MTLSRTTVPYISINIGDFRSFKQSEAQHASQGKAFVRTGFATG